MADTENTENPPETKAVEGTAPEGLEKTEENEQVANEHDEAVEGEMGEEIGGEESEYHDGEMGPEEQASRENLEKGDAEEAQGEHVEGEHLEGEQKEDKKEAEKVEEEKVEEEQFVEEPPPDPAAPLDLSDSKEALKPKFELRPDQLAEVEKLWELYQDYTPAYTDIKEYITEKELVYMLKCLLLLTYTEEQLQELIVYCVRPPDQGKITYEQFLKIVTIRQRDLPIEEELRTALQVMDPDKTGQLDREYFKEVLSKMGNKMPAKNLEVFIKEVDMTNDGQIGIEDVVGTMCIDLNKDDIMLLMGSINPEAAAEADDEDQ